MDLFLKYLLSTYIGPRLLIIITGPSGSGKTTLIDLMLKLYAEYFTRVVTCTSRPPRLRNGSQEMEVNGVDYNFLSVTDFRTQLGQGGFAESTQKFSGGDYYGTRIDDIMNALEHRHVFLNVDVAGAETIRRLAARESSFPTPLDIFMVPTSYAVLAKRLAKRATDSEQKIAERLAEAKLECAEMFKFRAGVIESDTIESDLEQFTCILRAELGRRRADWLKQQLDRSLQS